MKYRITTTTAGNNNKKDCCLFCRQKRLETERRLNDQLNHMYEEAARDAASKRQKEIEFQKTIRLLNLTNRFKKEKGPAV